MQFGKVIGKVISTQKTPCHIGLTLLTVQLLDEILDERGKVITCTDTVQAGIGDIVLTCGSSSARMTKVTAHACTDNAVIAIVDVVTADRKDLYKK
jgi:ethanolamine utilization protein EutN